MKALELEALEPERYVYTVSGITREIKLLLETTIPVVWVQGEVSNFKRHSSGHLYFSLKDEGAQIPCVMWRTRNLGLYFTPQDGMKVLVQARVTVYEKRGYYQLDVLQIQPAGVGELQLAFEQLKQRLKAEGLFDPQYKKALPRYPERIGIVTSPTGAAIRDLVTILHRRFPALEIILKPVRVQGEGAAQEIAQAIDEFNEYGQVDLLIVGRGGGSLEDLWAFNEEIVARAVFRSKIPIISAVGHEVDFSICDFVADLRAPTPSAAAELAVPDRTEISQKIYYLMTKAYRHISERIAYHREKLRNIERSYSFRRPADLIHQYVQRLDELSRGLEMALSHRLELARETLNALSKRLQSLGPRSVLQRGYSICYKARDHTIVRNARELEINENIEVKFYQGRIQGVVNEVETE
ncbi:MAG: exodeoxyribonuclease VII large subunit [candidate division KSB1 bacterium]|nr:exodeoxyribonuclease VII large subunit [candidate division KSB1 bacterium]